MFMSSNAPNTEYRSWKIRGVVGQVIRSFLAHWIVLIVALALVPGVWSIPSNILLDRLKSPKLPAYGSGQPPMDTVLSLVATAWNSLWKAGGLCVAIAVVRSGQNRLRNLLKGVAYTPAVFLIAIVTSFPQIVIQNLWPRPVGLSSNFLHLAADLLCFYLTARSVFCVPLVIDAKIPLLDAFQLSWVSTRNLVMRIIGLGVLLSLPEIFALFLESVIGDNKFYLTFGLSNLFTSLGVAVLYVVTWDDYLQRAGNAQSTMTDIGSRQM